MVVLILYYAGAKLREHIGKALQRRSATIRAALERYNNARLQLPLDGRPPKLQWSDVAKYAFLAEFDLLRNTREDVRSKPWTKPVIREAMTRYFKIERAREEVERLNIEIPRVIAYMHDEDLFLAEKACQTSESDPALAHQIELRRQSLARYTPIHTQRFKQLFKEVAPKGMGWSLPLSTNNHSNSGSTNVMNPDDSDKTEDSADDNDDDDDNELENEEAEMAATEEVLIITAD